MALFRRKRHSPPSEGQTGGSAGQAGGSAGRGGHRPWLDHGLTNGARVACGGCTRGLEVRLQSQSSVTVSHDGAMDGMALICTGCGRLLCADCALAASDNPYLPKCDRCRASVTIPMSR